MREILFRGKGMDGEWYEGCLCKATHEKPSKTTITYKIQEFNFGYSSEFDFDHTYMSGFDMAVHPETVGEFTGLYNGAGQRIFEDDIVRFEGELYRVRREDETPGGYWASTAYILQHIGWDDYISFVDTIDDYSNEICVEIIGNIHDNPELLTAAGADQKGGKQ